MPLSSDYSDIYSVLDLEFSVRTAKCMPLSSDYSDIYSVLDLESSVRTAKCMPLSSDYSDIYSVLDLEFSVRTAKKIMVWNVMPCSPQDSTYVSEERIVSVFRVEKLAK
jgi:hypothetical protein